MRINAEIRKKVVIKGLRLQKNALFPSPYQMLGSWRFLCRLLVFITVICWFPGFGSLDFPVMSILLGCSFVFAVYEEVLSLPLLISSVQVLFDLPAAGWLLPIVAVAVIGTEWLGFLWLRKVATTRVWFADMMGIREAPWQWGALVKRVFQFLVLMALAAFLKPHKPLPLAQPVPKQSTISRSPNRSEWPAGSAGNAYSDGSNLGKPSDGQGGKDANDGLSGGSTISETGLMQWLMQALNQGPTMESGNGAESSGSLPAEAGEGSFPKGDATHASEGFTETSGPDPESAGQGESSDSLPMKGELGEHPFSGGKTSGDGFAETGGRQGLQDSIAELPKPDQTKTLNPQKNWRWLFGLGAACFLSALFILIKKFGVKERKRRKESNKSLSRQEQKREFQQLLKIVRKLMAVDLPAGRLNERVVLLYHGLLASLQKVGRGKPQHSTPDEYAAQNGRAWPEQLENLQHITRTFSQVFYGLQSPSPLEFRNYCQAIMRLVNHCLRGKH